MAYGAIGSPLAAADLLGQFFWRDLLDGLPAGEALRQAKIRLADEMNRRQGFLDGEDQKTLISFVLYGDPLACVVSDRPLPKSIRYTDRPLAPVRTVNDRPVPDTGGPLPPEVMAGVKRVVSRHLPGMNDARLVYTRSRPISGGENETDLDPKGKRKKNAQAAACAAPSLVTLSKQVARPGGVHPRIARLTLDDKGKVVKLVVSR
jgi:hypothetical protein